MKKSSKHGRQACAGFKTGVSPSL